ncbi:FUSC family protein [Clostridium sp. LY3-2]|uniref:FUSC family protein n=1 Tax=Clostridium sp. LY3-2 TaxID=2942482 RepID=UPI002151FE5A|nr:FUSC family protein [Clostridium sp. LY3-2]MCR6513984.1 FUSC family protein [Clostridium sp. LY3-2]
MSEDKITLKDIIGKIILLVGIIIFVQIFSHYFGESNTLIGVMVITGILMFSSMSTNLAFKDAILGIVGTFASMGIISFFIKYHPILGLPINFVLVFFITYVFSIHMEKKLYLPFLLCYILMQGSPVTEAELPIRIASLFIGGILIALIYYFTHKSDEKKDHRKIKDMFKNVDKDTLQVNFAFRMALGITIAMFVGTIFDFTKGMWITSTVFSLTQPEYHETKKRIGERIFGTVVGAIIFLILFNFIIPKSLDSLALLVIGYIYTFIKPYKFQMIFVTINGLAAAMILFDASVSIPMRIFFVLVGIVIAVLVNKPIYDIFRKRNPEHIKLN